MSERETPCGSSHFVKRVRRRMGIPVMNSFLGIRNQKRKSVGTSVRHYAKGCPTP
jgi:hypothetical protein